MSWAKFDDRYDDGRKIKRAWRRHPRAVGLHAMAITYCARHETDGLVDSEWIDEKVPSKKERDNVLAILVELELFEQEPSGEYRVHDFLEYNPSAAENQAKRATKSEAGKKGAQARWHGNTDDASDGNGHGKPHGRSDMAGMPPSRPVPLTPRAPKGANVSPGDRQAFEDWLKDHQVVTGHAPPPVTTKAYRSLAEAFHARQREGWEPHQLRLATRAAHADDHRRTNGYDTADSILRPTKVGALYSRGLKLDDDKPKTSAERTAAFNAPLRKSA